jgi:hypothetical protein
MQVIIIPSGPQGEAARQPPGLDADKFNADQAWQVSLSACIQLLDGGHRLRV